MPNSGLQPASIETACPFVKAVCSPIRLEILRLLAVCPLPVGELADSLDLDRRHVSMSLAALLRTGLVTFEADGRHRLYRLTVRAQITEVSGMLTWRLRSKEGMELSMSWPVAAVKFAV